MTTTRPIWSLHFWFLSMYIFRIMLIQFMETTYFWHFWCFSGMREKWNKPLTIFRWRNNEKLCRACRFTHYVSTEWVFEVFFFFFFFINSDLQEGRAQAWICVICKKTHTKEGKEKSWPPVLARSHTNGETLEKSCHFLGFEFFLNEMLRLG